VEAIYRHDRYALLVVIAGRAAANVEACASGAPLNVIAGEPLGSAPAGIGGVGGRLCKERGAGRSGESSLPPRGPPGS
jgi:hypothetical protein